MISDFQQFSNINANLDLIAAPRRWCFDFNARSKSDRIVVTNELPSPVGYVERSLPSSCVRKADPNLMVKRSWDIALGPIKQIPMNLFVMWMSGNSISIFPIVMIFMMFWRPIQAIFAMQSSNVLSLALALYKCHFMGLLPTYASDWLAFVESPTVNQLFVGYYGVLMN